MPRNSKNPYPEHTFNISLISRAVLPALLAGLMFTAAHPAQAATSPKVIYAFQGYPNDGASPGGGSLIFVAGYYYGTTQFGGTYNKGAVYRVNAAGSESILYSFQGGSNDGCFPNGSLAYVKSAGALYGATPNCGPNNAGVVYSIPLSGGSETIIHSFTNGADGGFPVAAPTLVGNTIYGTTTGAGALGAGTIYEWNLENNAFSTVYAFDPVVDNGGIPLTPLIPYGKKGLAGACNGGSLGQGAAFVFDLISDTIVDRYLFTGGSEDGSSPYGNIAADKAGNIYGTDTAGALGSGVVYQWTPGSTFVNLLHVFGSSSTDGQFGNGVAYSETTRDLVGTTSGGGTNSVGTVFTLNLTSGAYQVDVNFGGTIGETPLDPPLLQGDSLYVLTSLSPPKTFGIEIKYKFY